MRRLLSIIILSLCALSIGAANKASRELAKVLVAMAKEQSIHPDSLYPHIRSLEARKDACVDPTEKAVMQAALGYLYHQRSYRSMTNEYLSDMDSTDMKSWSRDEWDRMAALRYSEALSDMDLLHRAKLSQWAPLLTKGKHDKIFDNDMLMLVWRSAQVISHNPRMSIPSRARIIEYYKEKGNRRAVLVLTLQSQSWYRKEQRAELLRLKDEYADLAECGEVYQMLSQCENEKDASAMVAWLQEGIKRYPRYVGIDELKRMLQDLQRPRCEWSMTTDRPYPGQTYDWTFCMKNLTKVQLQVYRVSPDFDEDAMNKAKDPVKSLKKGIRKGLVTEVTDCWPGTVNGSKVELTKASHYAPWEVVRDTLQWKAPAPGRYVMVMLPSTNAKLTEKVQPSVRFFNVTRLMVNQLSLPGDRQRIVVTDAMTGRPLEGVSVDLFKEEPRVHGIKSKPGSVYYAHLKTDHEGKVDVDFPKNERGNRRSDVGIHVECPDDLNHPNGRLGYDAYYYTPDEDQEQTVNLYTDRSIYRPGQTVHVGGVVSYRKQWDEKVVAGESLTLKLYNPNQKEVGLAKVTTDSMGVFSADFQLPENGLPGSYRLSTSRKSISVRVEEYKRPTFEVKTEEAPAIQMPVDSITLTGLALNYNGAPVRSAQVVGKYRFSQARYYWWGASHESRYDEKTDTVLTDAEGRFRVTIPVKSSKSDLYYGQLLSVQYVVTSPTGETHTAEQSVYLCSKPIRLFANVPSQNDKDKPENWSFQIVSSTGKELEGDVQLTFEAKNSRESDPSKSRNDDSSKPRNLDSSVPQALDSSSAGTTVYSCTVKSGSAIRPDFLLNVPSGAYLLKMQTILNGDTAKEEQDIVVFSQHDTRLVNKSKLWLYTPEHNFSPGKPARIMVGSSEKAYIYYTLNSNDELVESRLIQLNDSVLTIDIPYEKRYGEGLHLNVMTVMDNNIYRERRTLLLKQPDKQIRYKWTTFRDKLQPGQKETWQLQLTRPDGQPASASLMASLYDASLDAIHSHSWSIWHHLSNHVNSPEFSSWFHGWGMSSSASFAVKDYTSSGYSFSTFNDDLFLQMLYGYVKKLPRRAGRGMDVKYLVDGASPVMVESAPMVLRGEVRVKAKSSSVKEYASLGITSVDESLQGRIAGLDIVGTGNELGEEANRLAGTRAADGELDASDPVVTLRENFNETAFFYPALRTDAEGNVNIEFTLPESLTTWRLLGLAHTQDMLTTLLDEKVVAQKDLMAQLSLPRFLRQGDKASLSATIFNISERSLKGRAVLTILDAATEKVMLKQRVNFDLRAKSDSVYHVPFNVPDDCGMLIVRWAAETTSAATVPSGSPLGLSGSPLGLSASPLGLCSDGEQRYLPVLSSKEWITDTRALTYTKAGTYTEDIEGLFPVKSATNRQLTVEYVSQPVWYAIQALPSLAWPQNNDVLSLTTAYYAGAIAGNVAQQNPLIGQAIDKWKQEGKMQKSKLLQNEDLKNILLDETPWIALAERETERIQRLSTLFDEATQNSLQKEYLDKLRKLQNGDGSFSWYPGMKGNYYMTREVAYLLTRLKVLTGKAPETILNKAVQYIREDRPTYLGTSSLRYLYVLYNSGVQMDKKDKHNADSLMKAMVKHPENLDLEQRALAAIVLHKAGKKKDAMRYLESVKQFLVTNDEGLTYFEFPEGSFTSINRKQHIHVQVMEALMTLDPTATSYSASGVGGLAIDGMRRYLLRHKRTSEWDTPVNSANAIYALLLNNAGLLQQGSDATLTLNGKSGKNQLPEEESSFGFIRQRIDIGQVSSQQANGASSLSVAAVPKTLTVEKHGDHESWGGIYAQYLAPVSEVQSSHSGLNIRREQPSTHKEAPSLQGGRGESLSVGSRIHTRYVIEADRDYEYVAVNIPRAATMEPADQLSGYQWKHGLAYYRAVRDASTQYFIDYLPRGTYVIEEELLVERPGEYSAGIATIQCLYAPEFSAHTADAKVRVK